MICTLIDSARLSACACGLRATALELALAGVTLPVKNVIALQLVGIRTRPASGGSDYAGRTWSPIHSHSRAG